MFFFFFLFLGFEYGSSGTFNWTRIAAYAASQPINPPIDHTAQSNESYYMLAEGKPHNMDDHALLLTPIQARTAGSCLHFWYYQHSSSQQMKLNVYSTIQPMILWSHSGAFADRWLYAEVNINSPNQTWQAVFEAEVLSQNPDASIAIDDVSITRGLCPKPGDCTFENDLCGWINADSNSEIDWLVGQGVHSFGTGPSYGMKRIFKIIN